MISMGIKKHRRMGILLACGLLLTGCSQTKGEMNFVEIQESPLQEAQTTVVERGDLQITAYFDAQIGPKAEQLTFSEDGSFGEFKVQLGDSVTKGQVLAVAATEGLEEEIENKQQELSDLQKNYEHDRQSLENEIAIADQQLKRDYAQLKLLTYPDPEYTATCIQAGTHDEGKKRLQLQLQQLEETYELQQTHYQSQLEKLQKTRNGNRIVAPFDGIIIGIAEAVYGDTIQTSQYYIAVGDPDAKYARCDYCNASFLNSAEQILFWKDGKEYKAENMPHTDKYYMELRNNNETAYSEFLITDPDNEISMGDYGKVKVVLKEKKNVLLIPQIALITAGGESYVYRDEDGNHVKTQVQVGNRDGLRVEITDGLQEGDVIYVQE